MVMPVINLPTTVPVIVTDASAPSPFLMAHVSLVAVRTLGEGNSATEDKRESGEGYDLANFFHETSWFFDSNRRKYVVPARDFGALDEDIRRLQIAMDDRLFVSILYCLTDRPKELGFLSMVHLYRLQYSVTGIPSTYSMTNHGVPSGKVAAS